MSTPTKRGRPPKEKELLTKEELWDVLKFASTVYGTPHGVFTPQLVNSRMQDITLNPLIASSEKVEEALQKPKENQEALVGYSEFFELTNALYKRSMRYLSRLLAFDLSYECINIQKDTDYKSAKYKKDLAIVSDFLSKFDYKKEFTSIMDQLLRQEAFYSVFRDDGEKYLFQELPRKYSQLTGRFDYGMLFDFNMLWFIQPAVDINMYPPIFKEFYQRAFKDGRPKYIPTDLSTSWTYWVKTNPEDGFWAFKFTPEIATTVPFLSTLFTDVALAPLVRKLQMNQYIASASKIILGEVPFLKDTKGAAQKDQIALAPETLGKFTQMFRKGLSDVIQIGAMPLEELEMFEFKGDNTMYADYSRNVAGVSGLNSSFIYSSDKKNAVEAQLSMNVDENMVRHMYNWFENFLNFEINKRTKEFKFSFSFDGFNNYLDKKTRTDNTIRLATMGIVDENRIAHIFNTDAFGLRRRLKQTKNSEFTELLTILPNANTQFGASPGRPPKSDSDLSESGQVTRDSGQNEGR